jgi:hypothetical protein
MSRLAHIVQHYAALLGLDGWVITVAEEPAPDEHLADIAPVYGQRYAVLRVGADWGTWEDTLLHSTIVHELLHLHVEHASQVAEDTAAAAKKSSGPVVRAAVNLALEYAVDGIAVAITPHLPAPPPQVETSTPSRASWQQRAAAWLVGSCRPATGSNGRTE